MLYICLNRILICCFFFIFLGLHANVSSQNYCLRCIQQHAGESRCMGMHMCTGTTNKESINTFENMRWWYNTFNSYSYGCVDIKDLVCGSLVSSDFNIQ